MILKNMKNVINIAIVHLSNVIYTVIDEQEMMTAIHNDAKNVDRLNDRAYSRDYNRLGFGQVNGGAVRNEPWRISLVNTNYSVCKRSVKRGI